MATPLYVFYQCCFYCWFILFYFKDLTELKSKPSSLEVGRLIFKSKDFSVFPEAHHAHDPHVSVFLVLVMNSISGVGRGAAFFLLLTSYFCSALVFIMSEQYCLGGKKDNVCVVAAPSTHYQILHLEQIIVVTS